MIVPLDRPTIDLYLDDDKRFYCNEFGLVHSWAPSLQCGHRWGSSRTCVHRTEPMPHTMLFGTDWLRQLDWRSTLLDTPNCPVIAACTGDIVTVAFDVIGPIQANGYRCAKLPRQPEHCWAYRLHPLRWWDEENPCDNVYLGVWPD